MAMSLVPKLCGRISAHFNSNLLRNSSAIPKVESQPKRHEKDSPASVLNSQPCQLMRTWNQSLTAQRAGSSPNAGIHCRSGDRCLDDLITKWMEWDRNLETQMKIRDAVQAQDWKGLKASLCFRMKFGAEGLQAKMDAGFNAMNDLVVIQTAQGLCAYLQTQYPDKMSWCNRGIVIGYDARHNSKRFAKLTAGVLLSNNFRVYLFRRFVPTPLVPYTTLRLNCLSGVMITASHSAKENNGIQIYWSNGAQITNPHEQAISQCILANLEPKECAWDESVLDNHPLLSNPYKNVVPAYIEAIKREIPCSLLIDNAECPMTFTYSAMHGVGYDYIDMAFPKMNLDEVKPVEEQKSPDPDFPTTPSLNPGDGKEALSLAIEAATSGDTDLILAHNPDATSLTVGELGDDGEYKIFKGSELALLLGWWSLEKYLLQTPTPDMSNCVMLTSSVSPKILRSMADVEGIAYYETMSGFKWIANKALEEQKAGKKVLFAFEDSTGFMISPIVPTGDGIAAAVHVATMACYLRSKKCMSMHDKLRDLYEKYGYHASVSSYVECNDVNLMLNIFKRLRFFSNKQKDTYPKCILNGEFEVEHVRDLTTGFDTCSPNKKTAMPALPGTQMITFCFLNGFLLTLCSSDTDPRLRYYAEMAGKPEEKRWDELEKTTRRMAKAAVNEFYEPEKNGLQLKSEN